MKKLCLLVLPSILTAGLAQATTPVSTPKVLLSKPLPPKIVVSGAKQPMPNDVNIRKKGSGLTPFSCYGFIVKNINSDSPTFYAPPPEITNAQSENVFK